MASDRPFPPSARRLALARAAGLTPASPILVGALGCAAAAIALAMIGHSLASRLGAWVRAAVSSAGTATSITSSPTDAASTLGDPHTSIAAHASPHGPANTMGGAHTSIDGLSNMGGAHTSIDGLSNTGGAHTSIDGLSDMGGAHTSIDGLSNTGGAHTSIHGLASASDLIGSILAFVLPLLGAIAIAVVLAHLAQTRAVWLPRRKLPNAPVEDPQRGTRGAMTIVNAAVIGAVAVGWLFAMAPRLAALAPIALANAHVGVHDEAPRAVDATLPGGEGALLVLSSLAALAIAWAALGALDALVRYAGHLQSLRMTHEEQRADQRLAGADPRWRARREKLARGEPVRDAVAGASVLVLGDGVASAIAWDAVRRPVPTRTASGRGPRATQLLALARRHAVPVHREPELAALLARDEGPVPQAQWPRLAEIVAATSRR